MSKGKEFTQEEIQEFINNKVGDVCIHVSKKPEPCDHDWNNDGCNPEYCLKCGMSFMRYVFMECP